MTDFAQELATFHDVHELIAMMRERLRATLHIERMNLFMRDVNSLLVYDPEANIPRRISPEDLGVLPSEGPVIFTTPRLPDGSEVPWKLLSSGYRYAFPLRNRGELQGLLLLGTRRGEEPLSRDDLHLIGTITAPVALAIENSRLYGKLRRQLDEIRALKEYNENIIESSLSAIAVVAGDGTVLTANRAFWDLVGDDHSTDSIEQLFPPYEQLRRRRLRTLATHFVNRHGVEKEVTVTSSPLSADDVADGARVLVIGDITDRVRLERELQDKERLASLGLLAAGVAHEVNTPLTGISSYAQLLLAEIPPDDPKHGLLKKMEQQTFRASNLVNNLLDLIANRPRTREIVNVEELVNATVALHEDLLSAKSIQVETMLEPVRVMGNFQDLQQVLTNLLLNARDAVSDGGKIWIRAAVEGDEAVIRVRDDGKGITPDLIGRVFDPLVTSKRGQGVAISRRLIHACDGEIAVESTPGEGAEFAITLPRAERFVGTMQ
jgi:PAS domain S-box-containing protein